jgi:dihydrofolate reductase
MKLYLISAVSEENGIGYNNKIPWHITEDLKFFKDKTLNHVILMGRKTYESIGKPLPRRTNIVMTHHPEMYKQIELEWDNIIFTCNPDEIINSINSTGDVYVIGGEDIYKKYIKHADGIYLTRVLKSFKCDAFFPDIPDNYKLQSQSMTHYCQIEDCFYQFEFYEKFD